MGSMLRNTGSRMPPQLPDIRSVISNIVNFVKSKANVICTAPCDGFVLKMHYRWTFFLFLGSFFVVWYSWYHNTAIICVSHFNADANVRLDYINICLSYPFVTNPDQSRRYILFYRWTHYMFIMLAGIYYIPRKVSKSIENVRAKRLLEQVASVASRFESEGELVEHAAKYITFNKNTHNGLYFKFLGVNILALLIDLFSIHFVDFALHNRFITYGIKAYPYYRDPEDFTDHMSSTFPPFVTCVLNEKNKITVERTEKLGCHLTYMELYEKVFLFIWLWFYILAIVTIFYIIFLLLMSLKFFQAFLLRTAKPEHIRLYDTQRGVNRMSDIVRDVVTTCKVGDVYLLYRLKQHFSHVRFRELMVIISNAHKQARDRGAAFPPTVEVLAHRGINEGTLRQRKKAQLGDDQPLNPDFIRYQNQTSHLNQQQLQEAQQRAPLLHKNTSILIE